MKTVRKTKVLTPKGAILKKSIARNRCRAIFVGVIYLLAILALAGAACLPLFVQDNAPVGIFEFYKVFMPKNLKNIKTADQVISLVNGGLYALMLIWVGINFIISLFKISWLFKKRGSKMYGFNRNVYAMEDLGRLFSASYFVTVAAYFLIAIICGEWKVNYLALIVFGGGIVVHLFTAFIGAKVTYYDYVSGKIVEQKRVVGRFAPLFRNFLQLVVVFGGIYFFLVVCKIHTVIAPLLEKNGINNYVINHPLAYISIGLQALTVLCMLVLLKHATATTEYDVNGVNASGMKNFRVFSFFVFLTAAATAACRYVFGEVVFSSTAAGTLVSVQKYWDFGSMILAGAALVMFVIEILMRNMPKFPNTEESVAPIDDRLEKAPFEPQPHPNSPFRKTSKSFLTEEPVAGENV